MGILDKNNFNDKKDEVKRQLKNIGRDIHSRWKDTHILPQKKDTTLAEPPGSTEIPIPSTPSDMKKDLERLKQNAPETLPHENSWSKKQEEALKGLDSEKLEKYKNLSPNEIAKIKSEISKRRTSISNAYRKRDHREIKALKNQIVHNELELKAYHLLQEPMKLQKQLGDLDEMIKRVEKLEAQISLKLKEQETLKKQEPMILKGQQKMDAVSKLAGKILTRGEPKWSQLSEEAKELKESLNAKLKERNTRKEIIDNLFSTSDSNTFKTNDGIKKDVTIYKNQEKVIYNYNVDKNAESNQKEVEKRLHDLVNKVEPKLEEWKKLKGQLNSQDGQVFYQCENFINQIKDGIIAENELSGLHEKIDTNYKVLSEIFEKINKSSKNTIEHTSNSDNIKNLQKIDQLKNNLVSISNDLKIANDFFLRCKEYSSWNASKLDDLNDSEARKAINDFKEIIKYKQGGYTEIAFALYEHNLKQIRENIQTIPDHLSPNELSTLQANTQILLTDFQSHKHHLDDAFENLAKFRSEITVHECIQRGKELRTILQRKSTERKNKGMTKEVIDKCSSAFYHYDAGWLEPEDRQQFQDKAPEPVRKKFRKLVEQGWIEGDKRNYIYIRIWPSTPDNEHSLESQPPYHAYVNAKEGSLVIPEIYREYDQQWKDDYVPEEFPVGWNTDGNLDGLRKEHLDDLRASDFLPQLYQAGVSEYKEYKGINAHCSPLKVIQYTSIAEKSTNPVLSKFVPTGERKTFSYKDTNNDKDTLNAKYGISGSPLGLLTHFALDQNSEEWGNREVTDVEVLMKNSGKEADYLKWFIGEK